MALQNYGPDGSVLTINGRLIDDFGETASPFTHAPIDPKTQLRRGQGGRGVRLDRKNPGRSASIFLNPGGAQSAYVQGLFNSGANISISWTQIGTLEAAIGTDGVIVNDAASNRAGSTISDDQFDFQFNVWTESKGGE